LSSTAFFDANQLRIPIAINADSLESWFMATFVEIPVDCSLYFDLDVGDQDNSAAMLGDGSVLAAVTSDSSPIQGCGGDDASSTHGRAPAVEIGHRPRVAANSWPFNYHPETR